ncbi:MAG: branched-chain amino acid aminotransferase [Candidatus Lokiarchaeota archaeon]|nr:branched-chain amino acid aminotransferase [Candidatus Lokiarchaeota archaeon]
MEIKMNEIPENELKLKPKNDGELGFGTIFTDHMFQMRWSAETGEWNSAQIKKYEPFLISPAAIVLHYGIEIFEGLKAYHTENGDIQLFRPQKNIERLNNSAERMVMPKVDPEFILGAIKKLVRLEKEWVPHTFGTSLYIRPTMIGIDEFIGVHPAEDVLFYIILSPVGAYYATGFAPVDILVESEYIRAAPGGTGAAKTGGNYAASLLAAEEAKKKGYTQVLWLDAKERKYVEEVGTMNMMFVMDDEVVTSPLTGSILPGVTRDSVIQILKDWDIKVSERMITINEVIEAAKSGKLKEAFGTGTAAVITPVGCLNYKDNDYIIGGNKDKVGELTQKLYDYLTSIQYGKKEDPYGWIVKID